MKKVEYNIDSAERLGWTPQDFGCTSFDDELIDKVKEFQRVWDLEDDGLVGPATYRRIAMEREDPNGSIVLHGEEVYVEGARVVGLTSTGALALPESCWLTSGGQRESEEVTSIVTHWDVCRDSRQLYDVLERNKISSHFSIDNDGTIYQFMDPVNGARHAGVQAVNRNSIGIDLSNLYYKEKNSWYSRNGFRRRPIMSGVEVNGRVLPDFLGFYDVQVKAYKELVRVLCRYYDIPLDYPREDGKYSSNTLEECVSGKFRGVMGHFHCKRTKKDPASLKINKVIKELTLEEVGLTLDAIAATMGEMV